MSSPSPTDERERDESHAPDVEALMGASRLITAAVAHSLAAVDSQVTLPQFRVMVMIRTRGPLNLSAVAEGLAVNPSNASRTCDRLVQAGLLDRREDPSDRRHVTLTLTPRGDSLVDTVLRHRRAVLGQVVRHMDPPHRQMLEEAMTAFTEAAQVAASLGHLSDGDGELLRWVT
jgi:DNA-binding MarR family transcriptional regulator